MSVGIFYHFGCRSPFTKEMYVEVLRMCPSIQLMQALVAADDQGSRPLPIGVVILTVLENNSFDLVLPFIQELQNKTADGNQ